MPWSLCKACLCHGPLSPPTASGTESPIWYRLCLRGCGLGKRKHVLVGGGLFMLGGWLCAFVCDCVWGCVCDGVVYV